MELIIFGLGAILVLWGVWGIFSRLREQDFAVLTPVRVVLAGAVLVGNKPIAAAVLAKLHEPLTALGSTFDPGSVRQWAAIGVVGVLVGILLPVRSYARKRGEERED